MKKFNKNKLIYKERNIESKKKPCSLNKVSLNIKSKNGIKNKKIKINIFPNQEELSMNYTMENIKKTEKEKEKNKMNNMTLTNRTKLKKKYSLNKIKNINIFNDTDIYENKEKKNKHKIIDQNLKEKIQSILEKNFDLILTNTLLKNNNISNDKRYSYKKLSNSSNDNSRRRNIYSSPLLNKIRNSKKINFKNIFDNNSTLNKSNHLKEKNIIKKISINNNKNKNTNTKKNIKIANNRNNIIKLSKSNTKNGIRQEKTVFIENKDINIFNIDINKNNNSLFCYNIDNFNNEFQHKKIKKEKIGFNYENNNNDNKNKINNNFEMNENKQFIMNSSLNKYKKPISIIQNFGKYQRKSIEN